MSKIFCGIILMACFSESELRPGFYHNQIGSVCSDAGCDNHGSKTLFCRIVTEQYYPINPRSYGGWPLLRLKGGSGRNSKRQESVKKSVPEQSEPILVEGPPAEDVEDEEGTALHGPFELRY